MSSVSVVVISDILDTNDESSVTSHLGGIVMFRLWSLSGRSACVLCPVMVDSRKVWGNVNTNSDDQRMVALPACI